mgnify:CR=1 FL=1
MPLTNPSPILHQNINTVMKMKPEEKEVRYYRDGSGYPGCSAAIEEIYNVKATDGTLDDLLKTLLEDPRYKDTVYEKIEEQIWDSYKID